MKSYKGAIIRGEGRVIRKDGSVQHFELTGEPTENLLRRAYRKVFGLGALFPSQMGAVTHPVAVRNSLCDLVVDLIDAGAGAGTLQLQTSGAAAVATLTFSDPAFDDAGSAGGNSDGVATANTITDDADAAGGTTDRFVARDSDTNSVFLGSVGTTGEDINLSSVVIGNGDTVQISSLTYEAAP
jgi:hypothetical protein